MSQTLIYYKIGAFENRTRINIGSNILLRYKQGNTELVMKTFYKHFITYKFVTH